MYVPLILSATLVLTAYQPKKQWAQKAKVIPVLSAEKAAIAKRNAALPPIHVISDIFADIVERRKEQLTEFAKDLNGRSIRVATMCRCVSSSVDYSC